MISRIFARKSLILALLIGLLIAPAAVSAWWTGWLSPNFAGSYSPSAYKYGQYDSTWAGGTEVFAAHMKWNQTKANGVRIYSNNARWISWCGYCRAYYTQDHTDRSNRLHALGYATNFPSPKIDADDDNGNGRWEEFEVTSVNRYFPTTNAEYYFYTYFARRSQGNGTLYQTPAVSAKPVWSSEYQTYFHDTRPRILSYYSNSNRSSARVQEERAARRSARYMDRGTATLLPDLTEEEAGEQTTYLIPNSQYQLAVSAVDDTDVIKANLTIPLNTVADIDQYRNWSKTKVVQSLRDAGLESALAIVTFSQPTPVTEIEGLISTMEGARVTSVKAVFRDESNSDENSNIWTVGLVNMENNDFRRNLEGLITDLSSNSSLSVPAELRTIGIVALSGWLSISDIEQLNEMPSVFLADASPSFVRILTQERLLSRSVEAVSPLPDGASPMIHYDGDDLYVDRALAEEVVNNP